MKLFIQNMTCGGCANRVTNAIKHIDADAEVKIDVADKLVNLETAQPVQPILAALSEAGYPAKQI